LSGRIKDVISTLAIRTLLANLEKLCWQGRGLVNVFFEMIEKAPKTRVFVGTSKKIEYMNEVRI